MVELYKNIKVPAHITVDDIHDFVETGNFENAPADIVDYLDALEKVRAMKLRYRQFATKNHIINHLVKVNNLDPHIANKIYCDTIEYFYMESSISKQAYRNMYADEQDQDIAIARLASEGIDDLEKISKMREKAFKFRQLDQPDIEDFPEGLFDRPFKLYTQNPEDVGMVKYDRREIAAAIDGYKELTEMEKDVLKREAGRLPFKLFIEPGEDPRHEE
ncbi:hypothetical protein [Sediminibacter sp. Hel_I_10]|uniref:hypothetical protein n=1 Tax=Sediminibacter sp. Hel_I_10 TaxID=1392490 RepID=UPI00068B3D55|nr:hypothetical protein [Sediminibacter sp. Hel_I_10]